MTCEKIGFTDMKKARRSKRVREDVTGVPHYIYTCPRCSKLHLTTEEPGSKLFSLAGEK